MNERYSTDEKLFQNRRSVIYRGRRKSDDEAVILKVLRRSQPSPEQRSRFRREHRILERIDSANVVRTLELDQEGGGLTLVMEDFGGSSLDHHFAERRATLAEALDLAVGIANGLCATHDAMVIHKDINPSNVVWNADSGEIRLIDYGIASTLSREAPQLKSLNRLEGTLPYISPEQTGRMNRPLDYRSDLYSLGATLFWLLTGRPPFEADDSIAYVHAHLARQPEAPSALDPAVPQVLSDLTLRLLGKCAEDRYQSAFGVKHDLQRCRQLLTEDGVIEPFELGARDASTRLQIARKLYGRDDEVATLNEALDRVSAGAREVMLVAGYSGIGKTSLVHEVHKPMVARNGLFVDGKFDQFQRGIPYASLIAAFRSFVGQLLSEPDGVVAGWRATLTEAVGRNGAVVADVIPELALVIGEQPPVPTLSGAEAENRFDAVFSAFVRAFASADHPLALFMDDLQWADLPSLRLLTLLANDPDASHLLIIGAYRDNEVDAAHPLTKAIEDLTKAGATLHTITLGPLDEADTASLVADAVRLDAAQCADLADLAFKKTRGNPFFLNQLLERVHAAGGLRFDADVGRWTWDLAAIEAEAITDNVVDLLANRIQGLSASTARALSVAACIGNRFDLSLLSSVLGCGALEAGSTLGEALSAELIVLADRQLEIDDELQGEDTEFAYRFIHDRVQQAAHSLLTEEERKATHYRLGRLLLDSLDEAGRDERLFDIVNHLNAGADHATDEEARLSLSDLNRTAGLKAKTAAAYGPALRYLKAGLSFGRDDDWGDRYGQTLELHLAAAEAAQLGNEFDEMERLLALTLPRCRTALDEAASHEIRIYGYIAQLKLAEAVSEALIASGKLGVELPAEVTEEMVGERMGALFGALGDAPPPTWADRPLMSDPRKTAAMRILANVFSAAYYTNPMLVPIIAITGMETSIEHGIAPETPFLMMVFALVLCSVGELEAADAWESTAMGLVAKHGFKSRAPRAVHLAFTHVHFWRHPVRECMARLEPNHFDAYDVGDFEYSAYSGFMFCHQSVLSGVDLRQVLPKLDTYTHTIRKLGQDTSKHIVEATWQYARNLAGEEDGGGVLRGEIFGEGRLEALAEANDRSSAALIHMLEVQLALYMRDLETAQRTTDHAHANQDAAVSIYTVPTWHAFDVLTQLADYNDQPEDVRTARMTRADEALDKIRGWAEHCPPNMAAKLALCEAERARVTGEDLQAQESYGKAIELAREHGFLNEEALANELAGRYYLGRGDETAGRAYLSDAAYVFDSWGAAAKVAQLHEEFGDILTHSRRTKTARGSRTRSRTGRTDTGGTWTNSWTTTAGAALGDLDVDTVLRVSQALSSEIRLGSVLERVIELCIENAGATRGLLLMADGDRLTLQAESLADGETAALQGTPIGQRDDIPDSIVAYVERTGETVVLQDARHDTRFDKDAHFQRKTALSALCGPVVYQGERAGILYLENDLAAGAFTEDRIAVLAMLTSQAAISIENARLYEETRAMARSFERFVPKAFIEPLGLQSVLDVSIGDAVKTDVSVMFSDIRGFTALFESMEVSEGVKLLNEYMSRSAPLIQQGGGFIDKFIGDGIMALFPKRADGALSAAINMTQTMHKVAPELGHKLKTGIGIHHGPLMICTVGSEERLDMTAIGDTVNTAARLEAATKAIGCNIILSQQVKDALEEPNMFALRPVGTAKVYGKKIPLRLWEAFDADPPALKEAKLSTLETFNKAAAAMRGQDWGLAASLFEECTDAAPGDRTAWILGERCQKLESGEIVGVTNGDLAFT